jgi:hypothetical protein
MTLNPEEHTAYDHFFEERRKKSASAARKFGKKSSALILAFLVALGSTGLLASAYTKGQMQIPALYAFAGRDEVTNQIGNTQPAAVSAISSAAVSAGVTPATEPPEETSAASNAAPSAPSPAVAPTTPPQWRPQVLGAATVLPADTTSSGQAQSVAVLPAQGGYVTQDQFNAGLAALDGSLRQLIAKNYAEPLVSGPGAPISVETFAPGQRIDQLDGVTITNPTITGLSASAIPDLSGSYLSLGGGTLTGALIDSGTASSSFAGALGIGTTSPSDLFALNGAAYLADIASPANTTNRLYSNGGSLYWAGNLVGGGTLGNWSSDGTNVWRTGGKVGIGTTSPAAQFDLYGSDNDVAPASNISAALRITNPNLNAGRGAQIQFGSNDNDPYASIGTYLQDGGNNRPVP